MGLLELKAP